VISYEANIYTTTEGQDWPPKRPGALARELLQLGAHPYRLRVGAGDLNDRLQLRGLEAFRRESDDALVRAFA
jgi:hypothetical protein